ncbi:MerR family transcriptional regulator [Variovorax terrae]|uniref:MerR family transcriptional regulator n=1 Tax=Variovorax terrae TaxID=2923278 RepID=A0A9X1VZM3_9BURK|nr:MerR family transcriptional regulator [Variovorax terrae]MCJ0765819.1 MerR family transcriptional regulator [Variovorax terrae]
MNDRVAPGVMTVPISAVERDTGLSKDTLRIWERRYGFPRPGRDAFGERVYPVAQVDRLRLIRRLLDNGHRPGRVVPLAMDELQRLGEGLCSVPPYPEAGAGADLFAYRELIQDHDAPALRRALGQACRELGLARFVTHLVAPLNAMVNDDGLRGQMEAFEQRLYAECVHRVLHGALDSLGGTEGAAASGAPRALLATLVQEPEVLGLAMAEALLALAGCHCLSLGPQTPVRDIGRAAAAHRADIVVLSLSAGQNPQRLRSGLQELRQMLPEPTELWAGGPCPALQHRPLPGILAVPDLAVLFEHVARWQGAHL